jgi:transposase
MDFECFAILVLRSAKSQTRAASILGLSRGQVHDIMHRAVDRGLKRRNQDEEVPYLSLDEKGFLSHKHYVSVLTDIEGKRVLDVCEHRTNEVVGELLGRVLSPKQQAGVRCVVMDMWDGYIKAVREKLPGVDIVFDRFHVARYLVEAVDKTRITENKELVRQGDTCLKGSKFVFGYSKENITEKLKAKYGHLLEANLQTSKAWALKETFRSYFDLPDAGAAKIFFDSWCKTVAELGNRYMSKVAKMLTRYYHGLETFSLHRKTNSAAEGTNALIQEVKFAARGFRTFQGFRVAILFFLGRLNLNPQKTP